MYIAIYSYLLLTLAFFYLIDYRGIRVDICSAIEPSFLDFYLPYMRSSVVELKFSFS